MDNIELYSNQINEAIEVMREVAVWGRNKGFRVWPGDWLTKEKLITTDARLENFYVGKIGIHTVCAFILQWNDSEYWNNAKK